MAPCLPPAAPVTRILGVLATCSQKMSVSDVMPVIRVKPCSGRRGRADHDSLLVKNSIDNSKICAPAVATRTAWRYQVLTAEVVVLEAIGWLRGGGCWKRRSAKP